MIRVKQAVVVEGKYDKIKLSSIIDATIIETDGFKIFKDKEKLELLRLLAKKTGLIVLTDSDGAGFKIRSYIGGSIPKEQIINVYIPDIYGKEKRKEKPSAEGKLGVEGISAEFIREAFIRAGVLCDEGAKKKEEITKIHLYEDGFTGTDNSADKRRKLLKAFNLPERLSTNSMLTILNTMLSYDEYKAVADSLKL